MLDLVLFDSRKNRAVIELFEDLIKLLCPCFRLFNRKYPLCGYVPSPYGAAKEDNVVERILVCQDPNKLQGLGTPNTR